ncbi:double-strand break repair protein AddB [Paracraurococcus lichenis]|uniref:Double-strand break repair protein AddB n=1 Tax=Paracraurococcus lichenis TaxID=3064888 RepID=A0ABT9DVW7_9PROT|nr:double-strand break repair protein AddB [Paracraurococcus sp. LOR1-02]MDO9708042.1 double-strand break repair protein AddB [Paracraurococcus sp. LOR1-02]
MNLFDIPAHLPFLDCLAAGVLRAVPGEAPERLSRVTILLPTRRSARALRVAFLRAAEGRALLLPRMRALAGLSTEDADELALPALLDLPPAVDPLRRQAVLAGFIARLPKERGGPATPEQAWSLAGALATLLDEIALEEKDLDLLAESPPERLNDHWLERLETLVPETHAAHWQITLAFLRGVLAAWQDWLAREGLLDIGMRRAQALRAQTRAWQADPPQDPVVAAGIGVGGTIPAAEELLRVIANDLPRGCVVLHGLDAGSTEPRVWEAIREAPTHPFCGQQRLLHRLGATKEDVKPWPGCLPAESVPLAVAEGRPALFGMALRPAEGLPAWQSRRPSEWRPALEGLTQLTAPDAQAEAVAIALTLREALEDPKARVALVTPDRDLARRVSAELARHGVTADDSAGEPLGETPAGAFLRLLARMAAAELAPVPLLAALKHPLCAGGWERPRWLSAVRKLEKAALRGARPAPGLAGLRAAARAGLRGEREAEILAEVMALLDAVEAALGDFASLPDGIARPPADLLASHLAAAEALAATDLMPGGLRLYAGEEGDALAAHLASLEPAMAAMPPVAAAAWPALFDAAMDGASAPSLRATRGRDSGAHPRVEILGLLEARLLTFDRVVLGALDETVWPLATDPGPWMSRPMRRDFGLPEPEARIGRVCADFMLAACSAPVAVLSRAARRGGAPTVPARWLTRMETFLQGQDGLALPQSPAIAWAGLLDRPERVEPCARPAPRPAREQRPGRISVTQVETLIADPYAFYARNVLRLYPLDPLDADAGVLDYGNLVHAAMAGFVRRLSGQPWPGEDAARTIWAEAARAALAEAAPRPGLAAFWAPRLERIGGFAVGQEAALRRDEGPIRSVVEVKGELPLRLDGREVLLTAYADRIDILPAGMRILDYKTGEPPSREAVQDGRKPQLTLEAAIAAAGGFEGVAAGDAAALLYWKLSGGPKPGEERPMVTEGWLAKQLADQAVGELVGLVGGFLLGNRAFVARPHPKRAPAGSDYDHLSRLAEWAGAEDARGGA